MAPYNVAFASMTISQITINASGVATVDWSRGKNVAGLTPGAGFTIPASIRVADTYLIIANVDYRYVPNVGSGLIGQIPMRDQIILSPRAVARIAKT